MCVMRRGTIAWQGPATAMDRAKLLREISIAGPAAGTAAAARAGNG